MQATETRYARSGDVNIAYQTVGDGPADLLYVPTWLSQVEQLWEEPSVARFFGRLASLGRLVLFDRRGCGLSDPFVEAPTLEEQMDDVLAVMDAAGTERVALFAQAEAASMASLFAASYPEKTSALILYAPIAKITATEDVPWAASVDDREAFIQTQVAGWGSGQRLDIFAPSLAHDTRFREWFARLERLAASPGVVKAMFELIAQVDVRDVFPTIRVPTLIVHREHDPAIDVRHSRYLAERIPGARYVELPGTDNLVVAGDSEAVLGEIEEFLTGTRHGRDPDRVLATVLFTDIVDSTTRAAELGDRRWRELLDAHDTLVRRQLDRFSGREVKTVGDGFLATFDGPARAVRCAASIAESVPRLGVRVRAGLHTGELEVIGDDVGGMAVHIGARVASSAGPDEVLVSSTVKDLVVGSGIEFADRGTRELKGVPGEWRLFAVEA